MRYQVGSYCYSGGQAALNAVAVNKIGEIIKHNGAVYVLDITDVSDKEITYRFKPLIGGNNEIIKTVELELLPCGLLDYEDGFYLSWLIVGIWITTAGIMYLRRVIFF